MNRVAVIAIHGVADQKPSDTARRISDLLLLNPPESGHYTSFEESAFRIPIREVHVNEGQEPPKGEGCDLSHEYMRKQLCNYKAVGKDSVYESIKLSGVRVSDDSNSEVHLFEMYWADLSRAASGFLRIFVDLYQMLFYLCGLGRKGLDFAHQLHPGNRSWAFFKSCQLSAERLLVLGTPILNLCLVGLVVAALPVWIPEQSYRMALALGCISGAAVLYAALAYTRRHRSNAENWRFKWFGLVIIAVAIGGVAIVIPGSSLPRVLAIFLWLVAAVGIFIAMFFYGKRNVGAFTAASLLVPLVTLIYLYFQLTSDPYDILKPALLASELTFVLLCLCWLLYSFCCLASFIISRCLIRSSKEPAWKNVTRRISFTVHLTLALPGLLSALLNLVLWEAIYLLGHKFLPLWDYSPRFLLPLRKTTTLDDFARSTIELTASPYFLVGLVICFVLLTFIFWALAPVVLSEITSPPDDKSEPSWTATCLDESFRALWLFAITLTFLVCALPVAYLLIWISPKPDDPGFLYKYGPLVLSTLASSIIVGFVTAKNLTARLGSGLRSVIDVALDVTNWMRLNPPASNPRSRITARFVSLLKFVTEWRDPHHAQGYKAIIFVAHSQGTVIASEILRYLKKEEHRLLSSGDNPPLYLFTMGSPLRQIYSLRFPLHYSWARHENSVWPGKLPDPYDLQVKKWVNAYRSGDYVGRYLWHPDTGEARWSTQALDDGNKRELCIGAGAHTRYWDDSAPLIARELDALIASALSATVTFPPRATDPILPVSTSTGEARADK